MRVMRVSMAGDLPGETCVVEVRQPEKWGLHRSTTLQRSARDSVKRPCLDLGSSFFGRGGSSPGYESLRNALSTNMSIQAGRPRLKLRGLGL